MANNFQDQTHSWVEVYRIGRSLAPAANPQAPLPSQIIHRIYNIIWHDVHPDGSEHIFRLQWGDDPGTVRDELDVFQDVLQAVKYDITSIKPATERAMHAACTCTLPTSKLSPNTTVACVWAQ